MPIDCGGRIMEFADTLIIVNLAGLLILGFVGWTSIKTVKAHIMDLMNRELAEVRRQMRTATKGMNRLDDHVVENREKLMLLEVNLVSMQDELEAMSRKLERLGVPDDAADENDGEEAPESELVPPSEQRHIME